MAGAAVSDYPLQGRGKKKTNKKNRISLKHHSTVVPFFNVFFLRLKENTGLGVVSFSVKEREKVAERGCSRPGCMLELCVPGGSQVMDLK